MENQNTKILEIEMVQDTYQKIKKKLKVTVSYLSKGKNRKLQIPINLRSQRNKTL